MRKLLVIGIGTGNPEHVTVQAVRALNAAEVVFLIDKGDAKAELVRVRREICGRFIEGAQPRFVEAADPERDRTPADYGTGDELLITGRLGDVAELIRETRRAARARHGWIMDIYRLSRPAT